MLCCYCLHARDFRQCRNKLDKMVQSAHCMYIVLAYRTTNIILVFIRLMCTEDIGIPTIRTQMKLCTTDKEKMNTLISVFTHEPNMNVPDNGQSPF